MINMCSTIVKNTVHLKCQFLQSLVDFESLNLLKLHEKVSCGHT